MSEENIPSESVQNSEISEQYEEISKADAMAGVFTSPSETYKTIANTPKKNYWLLPVIVLIVVNLITTFLFMRDTELVNQTMEKQMQKVREQLDQNVKDGKISQEDSDKAFEQSGSFMNPTSPFFVAIAYGGALLGPFITLFILGAIYLIALKILKGEFDFTNVLNVVGLALLITAIGNLIAMVVSILKGDVTSVGPALLVNEESVGSKVYSVLTKIDLFSIWFYIVIAIGLSKIAKIDMIKSVSIVFGVWLLYVIVSSLFF